MPPLRAGQRATQRLLHQGAGSRGEAAWQGAGDEDAARVERSEPHPLQQADEAATLPAGRRPPVSPDAKLGIQGVTHLFKNK